MNDRSIEIRHLCKNFHIGSLFLGKKVHAVQDVSLSMAGSEPWILSIVGESGSGKTTLARLVLNLIEPSSGEILLNGVPLAAFKRRGAKKDFFRRVQLIAQNPFSAFSARRTVDSYLIETAMNLADCKTKEQAETLIDEILRSAGMEYANVVGKYPNQFSGGELQRIGIVRAMLPNPELIVADEPVAMIDASLRMNIVNIFKRLKDKYGTNFIYITHDLSTAFYISDYVAIMYRGNIIEFGPARQVFSAPKHPYMRLLLDSIPAVGAKWEDATAVPGLEREEYAKKGCKLVNRCPRALSVCQFSFPTEAHVAEGHTVLCHLYNSTRPEQEDR